MNCCMDVCMIVRKLEVLREFLNPVFLHRSSFSIEKCSRIQYWLCYCKLVFFHPFFMVRIQNGFGLWWRNYASLMCIILVCRIPTILYLSGFLVLRVRLAWKRPPPELFLEAVLCDDWPLVPENTGSPLVINEVFSTFVSLYTINSQLLSLLYT